MILDKYTKHKQSYKTRVKDQFIFRWKIISNM